MNNQQYFRIKKQNAVTRERKTLNVLENGRSADWIIPNFATGCEKVRCSFCYVARNQPLGNPLTTYSNLEEIIAATIEHHAQLPPKQPNQCDPVYHTYDIGEATDCLNPSLIERTNQVIAAFTAANIKPTFATKLGHPSTIKKLVDVQPNTARIRMSVAPVYLIKKLEVGSCKLEDRLAGIEEALAKGYEVHLNFSPVVVFPAWQEHYLDLFNYINKSLSTKAKEQLKCEVIFLTHNIKLHEENSRWWPSAENALWTPDNQEFKTNGRGSTVIRYQYRKKAAYSAEFKQLLEKVMPYCSIRYIF